MWEKEIAARLAGKSAAEAYNAQAEASHHERPAAPKYISALEAVEDDAFWREVLRIEQAFHPEQRRG